MVRLSRLIEEGRIAIVTIREAGCDGRISDAHAGRADERRLRRTAKSRGSGLPTLRLRSRDDLAGDGGKKARSPGRARISRKTIAQGRPECFHLYLWSARSRSYFSAREPRVQRAPGLPCAFFN